MFSIKFESLIAAITEKICKPKYSPELLEKVINGVPDIIGVYNTDHTIILYNQAGYDFYRATPKKIKERKCYEMLYRNQQCPDCPVDSAIRLKKIVRKEKYISKLGKDMEYCCNPVLDEHGKVLFVVEQLRDISKRKELEEELKESGRNYRKMVNLSPDAIVISVDGTIVLANQQAIEFLDNPIGESFEKYILPDFLMRVKKGMEYVLKENANKFLLDCKVICKDSRLADVEISSSYFNYKGRHAVISMIRDISKRNKELNAAAQYQLTALQKLFPIPEKADLDIIYTPAKTVSGDFYFFRKVDENLVVGILGDVSGKGISAALSISAFNVLFREVALDRHNPSLILHRLNEKVADYFGERYIAACCFSFDFIKGEARVVGAGINQFIFHSLKDKYVNKIVKGPPLGMFNDSDFDEQVIQFQKGDRFYFFTDGLDNILLLNETDRNFNEVAAIAEVTNYFRSTINDMLIDFEGIKDDCTLLALEIK